MHLNDGNITVDAAIGKTDLKCSNSHKHKEGLGCIDSGNDAFDANTIGKIYDSTQYVMTTKGKY